MTTLTPPESLPSLPARTRGALAVGGLAAEVGVADAAGHEPDERLAGLRLGEVERLHLERPAEPLEHGSADLMQRNVT